MATWESTGVWLHVRGTGVYVCVYERGAMHVWGGVQYVLCVTAMMMKTQKTFPRHACSVTFARCLISTIRTSAHYRCPTPPIPLPQQLRVSGRPGGLTDHIAATVKVRLHHGGIGLVCVCVPLSG